VTVGILLSVLALGSGAVTAAVCYQQGKGGFWFKKKATAQ
jgi:hypothetical protein